MMLKDDVNRKPDIDNSALVARGNKQQGYWRGSKQRMGYDVCKKPNYTRKTCWRIHERLANWEKRHESRFEGTFQAKATSSKSSPFTKEQMEQLYKMFS